MSQHSNLNFSLGRFRVAFPEPIMLSIVFVRLVIFLLLIAVIICTFLHNNKPCPNFLQYKHLCSYQQFAPKVHLPLLNLLQKSFLDLSCLTFTVSFFNLSFSLNVQACCNIIPQFFIGCPLIWILKSLSCMHKHCPKHIVQKWFELHDCIAKVLLIYRGRLCKKCQKRL